MSNSASTVSTAVVDMTPTFLSGISKEKVGAVLFGIVAIGLYVWSFVDMSKFIGSKDSWNQISSQVGKIWGLTLAGSFILFIAALLYFVQDETKTIYFILALSCITRGLAYSALAISAISK